MSAISRPLRIFGKVTSILGSIAFVSGFIYFLNGFFLIDSTYHIAVALGLALVGAVLYLFAIASFKITAFASGA